MELSVPNYEETFWRVDWLKWAAIKKDSRSKSSTTRINHTRHLILDIDINLWRSSFSHVIVLFVRALDRRSMAAEFGLRSVGRLYSFVVLHDVVSVFRERGGDERSRRLVVHLEGTLLPRESLSVYFSPFALSSPEIFGTVR